MYNVRITYSKTVSKIFFQYDFKFKIKLECITLNFYPIDLVTPYFL